MLLVGACPGQETANQAWLVEHGAAVTARPAEAGWTLSRLFASSPCGTRMLLSMAAATRTLAAPNAAAQVVPTSPSGNESLPIAPDGNRR